MRVYDRLIAELVKVDPGLMPEVTSDPRNVALLTLDGLRQLIEREGF